MKADGDVHIDLISCGCFLLDVLGLGQHLLVLQQQPLPERYTHSAKTGHSYDSSHESDEQMMSHEAGRQ